MTHFPCIFNILGSSFPLRIYLQSLIISSCNAFDFTTHYVAQGVFSEHLCKDSMPLHLLNLDICKIKIM